ncbi:MAG: AMP-binding protein [Halioglobus sp.]
MPAIHDDLKLFPYEQEMLKQLNDKGYTSLVDMFEQACSDYAGNPAFTAIGQTLTFAEIERHSRNFAAYLLNDCALQSGDRIAIQLPNLLQYPIVAWGALRAGLVVVNTNPLYTARELKHQFNDSGARVLVALADLLPVLEGVVNATGIEKVIVSNVFDMMEAQPLPETTLDNAITLPETLALGAKSELPPTQPEMNHVALLQYTGGTTGPAKGAVLTHGNVYASAEQSGEYVEIDPANPEIVIAPMPLYHIYGFSMNVVSNFSAGGHSILIPDPRDAGAMLEVMKQYPFTALAGVNTLFVSLMAHPEFDNVDFSHVKGVISGGAALVEEIASEWQTRTGTDIYEGYGLSETAATLTCNRPDARQLGTVGKTMPCMEVKLIDSDGNEVAQDEEGELLVRGPQVMHGYWGRPEATYEALDKDGWFSTGDIAVLQNDGFIKICDRLKDMILVSGFNVYPNEIEGVVYTHPDIIECAAIGIADEKSGEAVKLFVVSNNPALNETTLREFCRRELTGYKVPRFIEFRDDLPKSNVGKILRKDLRV